MVLDESYVLPVRVALDSTKEGGNKNIFLILLSHAQRRSFQDADWTNQDHYYNGGLPKEKGVSETHFEKTRDIP